MSAPQRWLGFPPAQRDATDGTATPKRSIDNRPPTFPLSFLRRMISKKKRRFETAAGADLDLVYVTNRLIAMAWPAVGSEALYRNPRGAVISHLDRTHGRGHWKIFNLAVEREGYSVGKQAAAKEGTQERAGPQQADENPIKALVPGTAITSNGTKQTAPAGATSSGGATSPAAPSPAPPVRSSSSAQSAKSMVPQNNFSTLNPVDSSFGFPDHSPPDFVRLLDFARTVENFLKSDERNVVAIHCRAGKGRTGTMCCCLMLYAGIWAGDFGEEVMAEYSKIRMVGGKSAVSVPSQRMAVKAWWRFLYGSRRTTSVVEIGRGGGAVDEERCGAKNKALRALNS